jgi:hypothetical protein
MTRLYVDTKYFTEDDSRWVSFESNPRLHKTKSNIYGRCLPCIMNLYEQLQAGKTEISLGSAYDCWKIVVTVESRAECMDFLEAFAEEDLGDMEVRGRFGSGDESKKTKVIVFNADSVDERDRLYTGVADCAARTNMDAQVTYHRACADLYHQLLGDSQDWREIETIQRPEMVGPILERIKKVVFWKK